VCRAWFAFVVRLAATGAILWAATAMLSCAAGPDPGGEAVAETSAALTLAQRGLVKDKDGNPVSHAAIEIRAPRGRRDVARAITASDGSFVLKVHPGTYDLLVTPCGGFAPQVFAAQSITGSGTLELVIVGFLPIEASGRILDRHGQPITGLGVCVTG